ncbi:MAG: hypothetical protein ACE5GX_20845, partial [Thermoanaerobaculia bacterium]
MSSRVGPLVKFLDLFLTRVTRGADADHVWRGRLLVAVSLFLSLATLGLAVANLVAGEDVPQTSIVISTLAGLGFLLIPVLLRATGAIMTLSWILTLSMLAAIGSAAWNAYGLYSPGLLALPIPVLIGLVLGRRRLGVAAAVVAVGMVLGYYALELRSGWFSEPPLDSANAFLVMSVLFTGIVM